MLIKAAYVLAVALVYTITPIKGHSNMYDVFMSIALV